MDKIGQIGQAYGAGMAGAGFNPIAFIKKPQVILRIVAWVSSFLCHCIAFHQVQDTLAQKCGSSPASSVSTRSEVVSAVFLGYALLASFH